MKTIRETLTEQLSCGDLLLGKLVSALESRERERDEAERGRVKDELYKLVGGVNYVHWVNAIYPPPKQEIPTSGLRERVEAMMRPYESGSAETQTAIRAAEAEMVAERERVKAILREAMNAITLHYSKE